MFFKNYLISVAAKFLWAGLVLGLFYVFCKMVVKISRRNVYVSNIVGFCFWVLFGFTFARMSFLFNNYRVCWFGLISMALGLILVKISVDFFFTNFAKLLYNGAVKIKKGKRGYGKLQTSQKG